MFFIFSHASLFFTLQSEMIFPETCTFQLGLYFKHGRIFCIKMPQSKAQTQLHLSPLQLQLKQDLIFRVKEEYG